MASILVSSIPASGHLNPIIAIAQAVQARGHQVLVATDVSFHKQIQRAGLEPVPLTYPQGAVEYIMRQFQRPARWVSQFHHKPAQTYFFDYLGELHDQLVHHIHSIRPDALLTDLNFYAGPIAADTTRLPYATYCAIVNTLRTNDAPPYGLGSDWFPPGHPVRLLWPLLNLPVEAVLWRHDQIVNKVRHTYGLPSVQGAMLAHSPYLSMVPTTDAYAYPRRDVPSQIMYVGPVTSPQRGELHDDFPWEWLHDERPTVYISMGTVVGAVAVFRAAIDAAAMSPRWKAVLAVGRGTSLAEFENVPENVLIRNFVPQLELLPHIDAVVSHGGNNTVTETLLHGKPLLVIPMSADQPESAGRVKACGAGLRLRPGLATPERLRQLIAQILFQPQFRVAAQTVRESYRQTQGAKTCAALVEKLAECQRPLRRAVNTTPTVTLADVDLL